MRSRSVLRQSVAVGLVGGALTVGAAGLTLTSLRDAERRQAEARATQLKTDIQRVVSAHTAVLYGVRSLHVASEPLSRADFHEFVADGLLVEQYPGAQAFELARRVEAGAVAAFEASVRSDDSVVPGGYPGFAVGAAPAEGAGQAAETGEAGPGRAEPGERWVVDFVEPMTGNEAAFGFDLATDPVRRAALFSARDSGEVTFTAPLRLVQETEDQRGVLVVLPLYRGAAQPGTVEARRRDSVGAALVVYRAGDMLATVRDTNADLAFEIRDIGVAERPAPARSGGPGGQVGDELFSTGSLRGPLQVTDLGLGGRTWRISSSPDGGPSSTPPVGALAVLAAGMTFSLLVATFVFHLGTSQRRALARARVLQASDDQRRALERNLHDGAQQRLLSASLELARAESQLEQGVDARPLVRAVRHELATSLAELRELAHGIHPAVLTDHGLAVALEAVAARAPVPVDLRVALRGRLPPAVEAAAYYLVSEAMANVAKHAGATRARIDLRLVEGDLVATVSDDGVGGADPAKGSGLRGLVDRAESLDGRLVVVSPSGDGTRLRVVLPCG